MSRFWYLLKIEMQLKIKKKEGFVGFTYKKCLRTLFQIIISISHTYNIIYSTDLNEISKIYYIHRR